ncbi:hypothetical protein ACJMK2_040694 [Sinanodonta woodiana]|uniref:Tetraspanin n=1 Tax=Sinanodonta woodiana TaxID=1069815 RepID=A0ABD3W4M6_SINWO
MDSKFAEQKEPLNKRPMMNNSHHFDHIDRLDNKKSRSKRNSISSTRNRSSRTNKIRNKDGKENCVSNAKSILQCYNVFIMILGCGALGVGIWLLVKEYNTREISAILGSQTIEIITFLVISGGGAATILAFCGCCGTMKKEKLFLGFYGVVLTLVLVTLGVGLVLGFLFKDEISDKIKERFKVTIIKQYGIDIQRNTTNKMLTDAWDSMQQALGCCGCCVDEHESYGWGIYKMHSVWLNLDPKTPSMYVPDSCCVEGKDKSKCHGYYGKYKGPPVFGPPVSTYLEHQQNDALYMEGCYDKALDYFKQHALIVTIVTGAIPVFLIIGIALSFYLCCTLPDVENDDEDDDESEV